MKLNLVITNWLGRRCFTISDVIVCSTIIWCRYNGKHQSQRVKQRQAGQLGKYKIMLISRESTSLQRYRAKYNTSYTSRASYPDVRFRSTYKRLCIANIKYLLLNFCSLQQLLSHGFFRFSDVIFRIKDIEKILKVYFLFVRLEKIFYDHMYEIPCPAN